MAKRIQSLLLFGGVISLCTASAAMAAAATAGGQQIVVVERALTDTTTDIGKKGDSIGDIMTFANPIFDSANRKQVGSDVGACIRTVAGKSWHCQWTNILPQGRIEVAGPFMDEGDSDFAIVGGTGAYASARGSMHLHAPDKSSYLFSFSLR